MPKHEVNITSKQYLLSCHYLVSISDQRCSLRGVGELVWRYVQVHLAAGLCLHHRAFGGTWEHVAGGAAERHPGHGKQYC